MQPQRPRSSVVICTLVTIALGLGVFVLPQRAHAALTTPSTVITGPQYADGDATHETLGWMPDGSFPVWRSEAQYHRRMLALEPEGGLKLFLMAYINDAASPAVLEFRMSSDNGVTWRRAFESAQQTLPLKNGVYDYHLVSGLNGSVWVAYQASDGMHVRKLSWITGSKLWTMGSSSTVDHIPNSGGVNPNSLFPAWQNNGFAANGAYTTSIFVQLAGAVERVWVITDFRCGNGQHFFWLVYTDAFAVATPVWKFSKMLMSTWNTTGWDCTETNTSGLREDGARFSFVGIGPSNVPAIVRVIPENSLTGIDLFTMQGTGTDPDLWNGRQTLVGVSPRTVSGTVYTFDFSATSYLDSATTSRLLVVYEGGYDKAKTPAQNNALKDSVQALTCSFAVGNQAGPGCQTAVQVGTGAYHAASVGVVGTTGYVAAREVGTPTNNLIILREQQLSPYQWSATPVFDVPNTTSGTTYNPTMAPTIASDPQLNSGLPPVAWAKESVGGGSVTFDANSGGNVFAWGWSSNFGWLATNCALFKTANDCQPYAYGVTIGTVAVDTPVTKNFSPSPAGKTYPLSGYGWSSNAGFLSFNRSDSVCVNPGCTDVNTYGNPPGQAYRNSTSSADPTAKYDKTTQKLQGWGRLLALCNYNLIAQRCENATGGWVHLQGYWASPTAISSTLSVAYTNSGGGGNTQITLQSTAGFPDPATSGHDEIGVIGNEYFYYTGISGNVLFVRTMDDLLKSYPIGTTVKAVSGTDGGGSPNGGEYGVSAYFTGNGYQLSGWAWSTEYGWIRFNPLIFIGYAWLESLYGNIFVNGSTPSSDIGDVMLPDAQTLSYDRLHTCGASGTEPCYVSTYRIEANGDIQSLQFDATGQFVPGGSSAVGYLRNLGEDPLTSSTPACGFGGSLGACAASLGGFTVNDATLQSLLLRGSGGSQVAYGFPAVTPSSGTYRNALGKLDVGGLTTSMSTPNFSNDIIGYTKDIATGVNRFGNSIFIANDNNGTPVNWTVGELLGQTNLTCILEGPPAVCPDASFQWPLAKLQNQVVHVKGDLTVGQDPDASGKPAATTFASIDRPVGVLAVASTANFPTSGTLILETGEAKEEYVRYTSIVGNEFRGVTTISGVPSSEHTAGSVRWVWRWPFDSAATKPQNLTIVVDGNLQINYNIIASDTTKDKDILNQALPNIGIKNAHAVAFIVKGNVIIAKDVNKVTGAYIVTSRDTTLPSDSMDTLSSTIANCANPPGQYPGCGGVFSTGVDNDASLCTGSDKHCNPLKIEGLLFARLFAFQRTGNLESIDTPAEQVTFDQRLFLNAPPGLEDVTKALPNPTRELP